jgi:hypothetical protein
MSVIVYSKFHGIEYTATFKVAVSNKIMSCASTKWNAGASSVTIFLDLVAASTGL